MEPEYWLTLREDAQAAYGSTLVKLVGERCDDGYTLTFSDGVSELICEFGREELAERPWTSWLPRTRVDDLLTEVFSHQEE